MTPEIVLGDFLRTRRSGMDHRSTSLPSHGMRRVPGLRREELAMLAGISTSYYTRIEQGAVSRVSVEVLSAIARALRLDEADRVHLFRLARLLPQPAPDSHARGVRPHIELLLQRLDWIPAVVLGRDMALLGWTRTYHRVFADHIPFEAPWRELPVNWCRLVFVDDQVRDRFAEWEPVARDLVGRLRTSQALHPGDGALSELVDSLRGESAEFALLWDEHPTRDAPLGAVHIRHRSLGDLRLTDAVLRPADDDDKLVVVFLPEPGSPTERALHVLRPMHHPS